MLFSGERCDNKFCLVPGARGFLICVYSTGKWSGLQFAAIMSNPLLCMVQLVPTLDGSVDVPFLNYVPIMLSHMDQLAALLGGQLYTRGNLN